MSDRFRVPFLAISAIAVGCLCLLFGHAQLRERVVVGEVFVGYTIELPEWVREGDMAFLMNPEFARTLYDALMEHGSVRKLMKSRPIRFKSWANFEGRVSVYCSFPGYSLRRISIQKSGVTVHHGEQTEESRNRNLQVKEIIRECIHRKLDAESTGSKGRLLDQAGGARESL